MAPKNKQSKGKDSGDAGDKGKGGGGLKAANSINVRHILVRRPIYISCTYVDLPG
jgi:NIMA-interacting peptidyl-prolyl cis-trans isomerase 4